jgi:hypothetical protein
LIVLPYLGDFPTCIATFFSSLRFCLYPTSSLLKNGPLGVAPEAMAFLPRKTFPSNGIKLKTFAGKLPSQAKVTLPPLSSTIAFSFPPALKINKNADSFPLIAIQAKFSGINLF